ncbi:Kinesin-like protein KIF26A [Taenia crassiceps]|uniref:Kinesin-like protein KIF26A n=1 Tax=Taenia crassiceps TaxID=6207 RepID=A0ABR4QS79_9CEST
MEKLWSDAVSERTASSYCSGSNGGFRLSSGPFVSSFQPQSPSMTNPMESPHIYHQVRPPSPPATTVTSKSPEHVPRMSSRHRRSSKSEEERAQLESHPHSHRKPNGCGGSHRSRSAHSSVAAEDRSAEKASGRPLSANYALRPLPPPPSPPRYHFGCLLRGSLPPMPSGLIAKINSTGLRASQLTNPKAPPSGGDVKVILCLKMPTTSPNEGMSSTPCVSIGPRRKQITLIHPAPSRRRFGLTAPKMFTFDAVFTQDDPLAEVCSAALADAVHSVVYGTDSCVLCFGHAKTSKSRTMLGSDASVESVGVIPCAIAWLFHLVEEQKETTKTRFSVRVSAVEVFGYDESFKDLLHNSVLDGEDDHLPGPAPSSYLRDTSPNSNTQSISSANGNSNSSPAARLSQTMDRLTEIRAPTAGHAAHLLDVALANRAQNVAISHTLFTLHVYQYKVEKNGSETEVSGGRSRLQLLYLGCGRYGSKEIGQSQDQNPTMKSLSLANMANVLLGLLTGQRQLPHRESAVTQLLREGMTGNHAQPCIIAHASGQQQHYAETLQVVQLASRLHRLRRRRVGSSGGSSAGGSSWTTTVGGTTSDSSTSSRGFRSRLSVRPRLGRSSFGTSTTDYTSSSEQSCAGDTVIYLGGGAREIGGSLGPRGLADGSVVHSADEWKKYASSGEEGTLQRSVAAEKSCFGRSVSHSEGGGTLRSGGLIKRVTPRTNATAWPRAAAVRKGKEVVSSTEETWVDGPKAMVAKEQQNTSTSTPTTISSENTPPPAPPYFGFTHHIVPQNLVQCLDTPRIFVAMQEPTAAESIPVEVTIKEPIYASIDEMKSCTSDDGSPVESCSSSSSSSDREDNGNNKTVMVGFEKTGDSGGGVASVGGSGGGGNGGGRGFGVLSDISERTEETEGGTSAPSSTAGGGHEEHENTLLDLAIQQSSLVHEDDKEVVSEEDTFSRRRTENLCENPQIAFLRPSHAILQLEPKGSRQQKLTPSVVDDVASLLRKSGIQSTQPSNFKVRSSSMDPPATEQKVIYSSNPHSDRSRHSPRRRKHSSAASSFDRVAAWVKDVSGDLNHVQGNQPPPKPPSHSRTDTRSSSCHRSCCTRRHRSHRTRRQRRHHHHHRHHETACSKCARDTCALCEFADSCCSRMCQKCVYCDQERIPGGRSASESPNHSSSCSAGSKNRVATKPRSPPPIEQSLQRHSETQKTSSISPVPLVIQRTVSFPWMPTQMSQSSTAHSSPCQPPPPTRPFWSPVYTPQLAPIQYYPWSLPTSPYLQSSMQAWSTQLPLPSSAASDFSQTALPLQYTCASRRGDSVEKDTSARISSSPASAPPQEAKKSKHFTLPSILCTLRRWRARRKERRSKKGPAIAPVEKGLVVESEEKVGRLDSVMTIPLRTSASLPGVYSRTDFPRAPSSDRGLGRTPQHCHYYPSMTPSLQYPMYRETLRMCAGDPSTFMNQMQQSLSTYRTGSRSGGMGYKDSREDRGSSGYESCRQGVGGGSGGRGGTPALLGVNTSTNSNNRVFIFLISASFPMVDLLFPSSQNSQRRALAAKTTPTSVKCIDLHKNLQGTFRKDKIVYFPGSPESQFSRSVFATSTVPPSLANNHCRQAAFPTFTTRPISHTSIQFHLLTLLLLKVGKCVTSKKTEPLGIIGRPYGDLEWSTSSSKMSLLVEAGVANFQKLHPQYSWQPSSTRPRDTGNQYCCDVVIE